MELYDILDQNEIDGQNKTISIDALDEDADWTPVLIHDPQELPAGNYDFMISFQVTVSETGKSIEYRTIGSVNLGEEEVHVENVQPIKRHMYWFNLSWDGGPFSLQIEMSRKNSSFTAICDFVEFSVTRRS